jgi:hypothetical protein
VSEGASERCLIGVCVCVCVWSNKREPVGERVKGVSSFVTHAIAVAALLFRPPACLLSCSPVLVMAAPVAAVAAADDDDDDDAADSRVIANGWPTGVEVCGAMNHGGPYPASSIDSTSVGTQAIYRFVRPVCFQDLRSEHLPAELRDSNPRGVVRTVNGELSSGAVDTAAYTTL